MTMAFFLSMPGAPTWNGKWSGDGQCYCTLRAVTQAQVERMNGRYYRYNWPDGWSAAINCRLVRGSEITKLRRQSKGFCGYDWMVDSIIVRDCIKADHEIGALAI